MEFGAECVVHTSKKRNSIYTQQQHVRISIFHFPLFVQAHLYKYLIYKKKEKCYFPTFLLYLPILRFCSPRFYFIYEDIEDEKKENVFFLNKVLPLITLKSYSLTCAVSFKKNNFLTIHIYYVIDFHRFSMLPERKRCF